MLPAYTRERGPCPACGNKDHTCKGENDIVPNVRAYTGAAEPGDLVRGIIYVPDHFSKGTVSRLQKKVAEPKPEPIEAEKKEEKRVSADKQVGAAKQGTRRKKREVAGQATRPGHGGLSSDGATGPGGSSGDDDD